MGGALLDTRVLMRLPHEGKRIGAVMVWGSRKKRERAAIVSRAGCQDVFMQPQVVLARLSQSFLTCSSFAILLEFTPVRRWRNWQTHQLEVLAPKRHRGSSPLFRTKDFSVPQSRTAWKAE